MLKLSKIFPLAASLLFASYQTPLAAEKLTIMLDWLPDGWDSALYLGMDNGCFSDQGVDITVERGAGGTDTVAKVAAGLAEIGSADLSTVMLGIDRYKTPVKVLLPLYSNSPFGVLTLESHKVGSLKELEGLTIAAGPGDSNLQVLPIIMKRAGADFSKVKIEQADFSALLGLLLQDRVNAILSFKTTGSVLAVAAANAGRELDFYHYGKDIGTYGMVFFGSERFLQEKPDTARRVAKGLECAYQAAYKDSEAAVAAFLARFPEKNREDVVVGARAASQLIFDTETFAANGFNWDEGRLKNTLKLALEAQGINSEVKKVDNYLYKLQN